jgi:hypothetical protein
MFSEIPPPAQLNQVMPIDVQLNEELLESIQSRAVNEDPIPEPEIVEAQPAVIESQPLVVETEPTVIETQPVEESPIEEQPIYQEPVLVLDQQYARPQGSKYFFAAILGCSLLLLFMGLTWPRYTASIIPKVTESPKPVKQIIKPEPEEQPVVPKNEIEVAPEPTVVESIPEAEPVNPVPEPPIKNTVLKSSPEEKPIDDEGRIRLARALNSQGYSMIKQGRAGEAILVLERSLQTFPKGTKDAHYGYALYNLATAWRKAGRPDLAIPILEKRLLIADQRDLVARELFAARREAKDQGFESFKN